MGTAPETFLYGAMQMIAGVSCPSFTCFLSCDTLLSEADDPMAVSDVEAGMWLSAAAARLPFLLALRQASIMVRRSMKAIKQKWKRHDCGTTGTVPFVPQQGDRISLRKLG